MPHPNGLQKFMLDRIKNYFLNRVPRKWVILLGVALFMTLVFFELFWVWEQRPSHRSGSQQRRDLGTEVGSTEASTKIPKGYSLVPLELVNADSMKTLVPEQARVDLYLPSARSGQKGRRIAHSVQLLRAPLDPTQFGVLIEHGQVANLMSINSGFIAVLVSSEDPTTSINSHARKPETTTSIEYQNENSNANSDTYPNAN